MHEVINLTPHRIKEVETGNSFDPSGEVARVDVTMEPVGTLNGSPLFKASYGEVVGLPAPQAGVIYIVSGMVLAAVKGRPDVVAPGELVRDPDGKPIGCRGFKVSG